MSRRWIKRSYVTSPDEGWHGFPLTTCTDDRWQIWALGEFYGNPHPNLSHALETSADLNGHFIIFGYEKHKKRWHILTDRFGTVHAYLANDGKRVALGTFSPSVAESASTKQLDWAIEASSNSAFPQQHNLWRDLQVFRLPPTPSSTQMVSSSASAQPGHGIARPDPALISKHWLRLKLFHTVILERPRERFAVPISGGLDRSTLIPSPIKPPAENLFSSAYEIIRSDVIARQLAKTRSLNLQTWTINLSL